MRRSTLKCQRVSPRLKLSVWMGIQISTDQPCSSRWVAASQMPSQSALASAPPGLISAS